MATTRDAAARLWARTGELDVTTGKTGNGTPNGLGAFRPDRAALSSLEAGTAHRGQTAGR